MIAFRDFEPEHAGMFSRTDAWKRAFDQALSRANEWIDQDSIEVINVETLGSGDNLPLTRPLLGGPDRSSSELESDPCSRCGRPVARIPLLYVGKDGADSGASRIVCDSCLESGSRRKKILGFFGGAFWLIDFGGLFFWVGSLIVVAIVAALIGSSSKR
jgi:hypothetical protein